MQLLVGSGKRERVFLESLLPPRGDPVDSRMWLWGPWCLPGATHTFRDVMGLPSALQPQRSGSPTGGEARRAGWLCKTALPAPLGGLGVGQASPSLVHSSCPTRRSQGARWYQLHSRICQGKEALLHPPAEVNCPAPASRDLSHKHGRNSAKPGCCPEPPSLGTGKPLKEARKDHRSAWTEEVTSRQICSFFFFCGIFFLFFFLFVFCLFVFIFLCPMLWLSEIL